jgi:hypothetical protein
MAIETRPAESARLLNDHCLPFPPDAVDSLETAFTLDELSRALQDAGKAKSPGPDRIPMELYVACWKVCGPLLLDALDVPDGRPLSWFGG